MNYYISRHVHGEFGAVMEKLNTLLREEGFAVKTEIDVTATLRDKLGVDYKKYHILGACNPGYAYEALQAEDKIGVLLPCNVILIEQEPGLIEVAAMDAAAMMTGMGNPVLAGVAARVNQHLQKVVEAV
ncbi:MAG TPA: DUF302 domain-containing protein [Bacteroidales bacterium]|nr:DUF302 domain-containing protein [Bacteroidales bacterium]HRZ77237.1 DUF302 domain-containing protein [Bacteroidales bacterium]